MQISIEYCVALIGSWLIVEIDNKRLQDVRENNGSVACGGSGLLNDTIYIEVPYLAVFQAV